MLVVDHIIVIDRSHRADPHGLVHEVVDKKAEKPKGQAAVIQVVPFVPDLGAGKDGRDHEA